MAKKITFLATLPQTQSAIKIGGDNTVRFQLDVPEQEKINVLPLVNMTGKILKITVEIANYAFGSKRADDDDEEGEEQENDGYAEQLEFDVPESPDVLSLSEDDEGTDDDLVDGYEELNESRIVIVSSEEVEGTEDVTEDEVSQPAEDDGVIPDGSVWSEDEGRWVGPGLAEQAEPSDVEQAPDTDEEDLPVPEPVTVEDLVAEIEGEAIGEAGEEPELKEPTPIRPDLIPGVVTASTLKKSRSR